MREFVHSKIELCKQDAARIRSTRDDEERQLMPTIVGTETRVRAFCVSVEALTTWKETSTLEQKYSGRCLLAYANSVVELSKPAFNYLRGMGPRPTTPQVRAIIQELDEAANFVDGDKCREEVSDNDRQSRRERVLACVPPLKAYFEYVDHAASTTQPWPVLPRNFKKIYEKRFQTGMQEIKEQVKKDYPDVKLIALQYK
jgi:hypothetical protein